VERGEESSMQRNWAYRRPLLIYVLFTNENPRFHFSTKAMVEVSLKTGWKGWMEMDPMGKYHDEMNLAFNEIYSFEMVLKIAKTLKAGP
jgi:hypothetical protein